MCIACRKHVQLVGSTKSECIMISTHQNLEPLSFLDFGQMNSRLYSLGRRLFFVVSFFPLLLCPMCPPTVDYPSAFLSFLVFVIMFKLNVAYSSFIPIVLVPFFSFFCCQCIFPSISLSWNSFLMYESIQC